MTVIFAYIGLFALLAFLIALVFDDNNPRFP